MAEGDNNLSLLRTGKSFRVEPNDLMKVEAPRRITRSMIYLSKLGLFYNDLPHLLTPRSRKSIRFKRLPIESSKDDEKKGKKIIENKITKRLPTLKITKTANGFSSSLNSEESIQKQRSGRRKMEKSKIKRNPQTNSIQNILSDQTGIEAATLLLSFARTTKNNIDNKNNYNNNNNNNINYSINNINENKNSKKSEQQNIDLCSGNNDSETYGSESEAFTTKPVDANENPDRDIDTSEDSNVDYPNAETLPESNVYNDDVDDANSFERHSNSPIVYSNNVDRAYNDTPITDNETNFDSSEEELFEINQDENVDLPDARKLPESFNTNFNDGQIENFEENSSYNIAQNNSVGVSVNTFERNHDVDVNAQTFSTNENDKVNRFDAETFQQGNAIRENVKTSHINNAIHADNEIVRKNNISHNVDSLISEQRNNKNSDAHLNCPDVEMLNQNYNNIVNGTDTDKCQGNCENMIFCPAECNYENNAIQPNEKIFFNVHRGINRDINMPQKNDCDNFPCPNPIQISHVVDHHLRDHDNYGERIDAENFKRTYVVYRNIKANHNSIAVQANLVPMTQKNDENVDSLRTLQKNNDSGDARLNTETFQKDHIVDVDCPDDENLNQNNDNKVNGTDIDTFKENCENMIVCPVEEISECICKNNAIQPNEKICYNVNNGGDNFPRPNIIQRNHAVDYNLLDKKRMDHDNNVEGIDAEKYQRANAVNGYIKPHHNNFSTHADLTSMTRQDYDCPNVELLRAFRRNNDNHNARIRDNIDHHPNTLPTNHGRNEVLSNAETYQMNQNKNVNHLDTAALKHLYCNDINCGSSNVAYHNNNVTYPIAGPLHRMYASVTRPDTETFEESNNTVLVSGTFPMNPNNNINSTHQMVCPEFQKNVSNNGGTDITPTNNDNNIVVLIPKTIPRNHDQFQRAHENTVSHSIQIPSRRTNRNDNFPDRESFNGGQAYHNIRPVSEVFETNANNNVTANKQKSFQEAQQIVSNHGGTNVPATYKKNDVVVPIPNKFPRNHDPFQKAHEDTVPNSIPVPSRRTNRNDNFPIRESLNGGQANHNILPVPEYYNNVSVNKQKTSQERQKNVSNHDGTNIIPIANKNGFVASIPEKWPRNDNLFQARHENNVPSNDHHPDIATFQQRGQGNNNILPVSEVFETSTNNNVNANKQKAFQEHQINVSNHDGTNKFPTNNNNNVVVPVPQRWPRNDDLFQARHENNVPSNDHHPDIATFQQRGQGNNNILPVSEVFETSANNNVNAYKQKSFQEHQINVSNHNGTNKFPTNNNNNVVVPVLQRWPRNDDLFQARHENNVPSNDHHPDIATFQQRGQGNNNILPVSEVFETSTNNNVNANKQKAFQEHQINVSNHDGTNKFPTNNNNNVVVPVPKRWPRNGYLFEAGHENNFPHPIIGPSQRMNGNFYLPDTEPLQGKQDTESYPEGQSYNNNIHPGSRAFQIMPNNTTNCGHSKTLPVNHESNVVCPIPENYSTNLDTEKEGEVKNATEILAQLEQKKYANKHYPDLETYQGGQRQRNNRPVSRRRKTNYNTKAVGTVKKTSNRPRKAPAKRGRPKKLQINNATNVVSPIPENCSTNHDTVQKRPRKETLRMLANQLFYYNANFPNVGTYQEGQNLNNNPPVRSIQKPTQNAQPKAAKRSRSKRLPINNVTNVDCPIPEKSSTNPVMFHGGHENNVPYPIAAPSQNIYSNVIRPDVDTYQGEQYYSNNLPVPETDKINSDTNVIRFNHISTKDVQKKTDERGRPKTSPINNETNVGYYENNIPHPIEELSQRMYGQVTRPDVETNQRNLHNTNNINSLNFQSFQRDQFNNNISPIDGIFQAKLDNNVYQKQPTSIPITREHLNFGVDIENHLLQTTPQIIQRSHDNNVIHPVLETSQNNYNFIRIPNQAPTPTGPIDYSTNSRTHHPQNIRQSYNPNHEKPTYEIIHKPIAEPIDYSIKPPTKIFWNSQPRRN